ncbi:HD-GYP domain-containing protein [Pararhizobium antarcticum]|uniref:Phosphohydrolase n=1 Tax=Pararhizobium antarcticum TaxID=1798805 RepID=A0A657LST3_9HYPH|nr:HD-GYP domain-containing protein [Pararhizobium antarcticum]OJF96770.1 phosphohydrolase [Pararhizobium antarcticum]OJF98944.1 phosphohydrolase [Rhizobium sp. 58]
MLKRIEISQLRVGMFIESLEGPWLNSPLAGRRFLLESETDAQTLKRSNLSGIFINTAKGVDVPSTAKASAAVDKMRLNLQTPVRQKRQREAIARILSDATAMLKGVFDGASAGGDVTVAMVAPIVAQITQASQRHGDIILSMTRLKTLDEATFLHSIAVSALMIRFGRYLNLDEQTIRTLGMAGLLHDIGKLSVPSELLSKDCALSESEMYLMREHPSKGHATLSRQPDMPEIVLDVCLHHHERIDGKGYPRALAGDEISRYARIAAICDVYDAITSARPYKKAWSAQEASTWMLERKGYFDRALLLQFLNGVLHS